MLIAIGLVLAGLVIALIRSDASISDRPTRTEDAEDLATFGR